MVEPRRYRDRVYIIKDIILTLAEYGQLNQTTLLSFCGLNLTKHKQIIDELQINEMIRREEKTEGKRSITIYKATKKGLDFCHQILEPYEELFPRSGKSANDARLSFLLIV